MYCDRKTLMMTALLFGFTWDYWVFVKELQYSYPNDNSKFSDTNVYGDPGDCSDPSDNGD